MQNALVLLSTIVGSSVMGLASSQAGQFSAASTSNGDRRSAILLVGTVRKNCSATAYSTNLIEFVQRSLSSKGFYSGPIDGKERPSLRYAVSHFRSQEGLIDGYVDVALITHLDMGSDLIDVPDCK